MLLTLGKPAHNNDWLAFPFKGIHSKTISYLGTGKHFSAYLNTVNSYLKTLLKEGFSIRKKTTLATILNQIILEGVNNFHKPVYL
jgi:hypothetical protein